MKKRGLALVMSLLMAAGLVACGSNAKNAETTATGMEESAKEAAADAGSSEKTKVRMMYWNKEETMKPFLDLAKEKLPNIDISRRRS